MPFVPKGRKKRLRHNGCLENRRKMSKTNSFVYAHTHPPHPISPSDKNSPDIKTLSGMREPEDWEPDGLGSQ